MAKTIAVCNQKGGVGKTTTAVNLAACLAVMEKKTLLIDIDPQANTSQSVGINETQDEDIYEALTLAETMEGLSAQRLSQIIKSLPLEYKLEYLKVLPSSPGLAKLEMELVNEPNRERRLQKLVSVASDGYDYIIVDSPPSLNLLTINTLTAADSVIIPVQCEYFSLQGVAELLNTIELIKANLNKNLKIEGALLTMLDSRNSLSKQVVEEVRKNFPGRTFNTIIPRNVRLAEAPSHGKPILLYDIQSAGSQAYMKLTEELLNG
ncbi:MAG: ParA family protein [Fibromonadaceae bacterium]|jgi:chromosome partitioning protein|nr:ParA family protein [Fibromonadaceae bacterium]